MALPFASSPPPSHPGTPAHGLSRPGTPSKSSKTFVPFLSAFIRESSNSAVLEKHQHISSSRFQSKYGHVPAFVRPLAPYFTAVPVPIPRTTKLLLVPVLNVLLSSQSRSNLPPLTPRRSPDGHFNHHQNPRIRPSPLGFVVIILLTVFALLRIRSHSPHLNLPFVPSSSNILTNEQIARVWEWEIGRGQYPSSRRLPTTVALSGIPNPGVDSSTWDYHPDYDSSKSLHLPRGPMRFPSQFAGIEAIRPSGPSRHYLNISTPQPLSSGKANLNPFPPRPLPQSVIDLDIVMDYCDFTTGKYVRDCLEILRAGAGLDKGHRFRRGNMKHWQHLFSEDRKRIVAGDSSPRSKISPDGVDIMRSLGYVQPDPHDLTPAAAHSHQNVLGVTEGVSAQQIAENLRPPSLDKRQNIVGWGSDAKPHPSHPTADPLCDPDYPKIFHIFWAGAFTDKPYLAVTSFLYTQNLGLQYEAGSDEMNAFLAQVCRPQLWVWINPGPAASLPNPHARQQMFNELRDNPWSAPFLNDRFGESVKFKLWNTTEQLDGIPELREHWRSLPLFNSGGVKYGAPSHIPEKEEMADEEPEGVLPEEEEEQHGRFGEEVDGDDAKHVGEALKVIGDGLNATAVPVLDKKKAITRVSSKRKKTKDELLNRIGSTSSKEYDRLTVVLSDMARFVLTHRFGGVYLDADTIFLRDWEELSGWKGAFAYRWSRLEKYNTAVLKMQRNSAIGSFLFKSALANGLDFHPMTISRYTKDASLEGLLLRLPDALFDSAWLNTEYYQRDRPAYPYFKRFEDFFDPPKEDSAAPGAIGFEGFFRGAYSYHFHNFWWIPFDQARNWPDLGPRFAAGERKARAAAMQARLATEQQKLAQASENSLSRSPTKPPVDGAQAGQAEPTHDMQRTLHRTNRYTSVDDIRLDEDDVRDDVRDLSWATVLKRTFEQYLREESPNMYGEWLRY